MTLEDEQKLIKGCIEGKKDSQKQLYLEYGPLIKSVSQRYAANAEEAEDLFQDIFVFILTHFKEYTHITSLSGWLNRIAINKAVDFYRKRRIRAADPIEDEGIFADSNTAPMIPEVLTMSKLVEFINMLPEKRRIAFNLYVIDELSQDEICEIMDETPTNVRTLISRSKESLRQKIRSYLNHEEFEI